ncbi:MAG: hypothetical protein Ta2F_13040 [Termitinemataceae bacterium]|nr:MAG: hypothetical protein Ta2F_13040 [Termitinemataceae bacterium]
MKKKKKPRFFCDACGTEVAANANTCPRCGKYFASIRCPKCFHTGDQAAFAKGCPNCGYSAPPGKKQGGAGLQKKISGSTRRKGSIYAAIPVWLYVFLASFIVLLLALLFMHIV